MHANPIKKLDVSRISIHSIKRSDYSKFSPSTQPQQSPEQHSSHSSEGLDEQ
jgi:hypothetical protein